MFRSSWVLCLVVIVDQKPSPPTVKCCFLGGGGYSKGEGKRKGRWDCKMTAGRSTHKTPWWGPSGRLLRMASSLRDRSCLRPSSSCGTPGGGWGRWQRGNQWLRQQWPLQTESRRRFKCVSFQQLHRWHSSCSIPFLSLHSTIFGQLTKDYFLIGLFWK